LGRRKAQKTNLERSLEILYHWFSAREKTMSSLGSLYMQAHPEADECNWEILDAWATKRIAELERRMENKEGDRR
jgi:hypothetical protein